MTKKQVGKRFLQIIIVLFGISFFTFGLTYLSPGDPAEIMLTECGNLPTPELLEQTRHDLGLDQPFLVQYGSWLKGVVTGDMGQSYSFKMPVTDKLVSCFWPTLKMSLLALLMMVIISIPLGILAAVYQNKFPDYFVRGITFVGVSVPSFWLGLILLSIFGVQLRWINVAGGSTDFKSMILPALTLALVGANTWILIFGEYAETLVKKNGAGVLLMIYGVLAVAMIAGYQYFARRGEKRGYRAV